jgi:uncharacterized membrane protein YeaQ/YmgE (transglycosylase-associated protein family)
MAMRKKKKKGISPTLILGFIIDIVAAWYIYDFLRAGEKVSGYVLAGVYGFVRILIIIRAIKRLKKKRDFNGIYPEN